MEASSALRLPAESVSEREWMFEVLVEEAPDLIARFDGQLRHLYVNRAVERATGIPRAHFRGRTQEELGLPAELIEAFRGGVRAAFDSGREQGSQVGWRGPQGPVHYDARVVPERAPDGQVGSVLVVLRAVAGQARAEPGARAADRAARLQSVTASLSEVLSVAEVSRVGLEQMMGALGAAAGAVSLLEPEGQALETVQMLGYSEAQRTRFGGRLLVAEAVPTCDAVRTGQALWLESPEEFAVRYPHLAHYHRGGMGGMAAVPLVVDGRVLGCFALSFERSRRLEAEERDFCMAIARQCAQALDRARALEALRTNEARFRRFVASNIIGIAFGDGGDALTDANDAFLELLGYGREDVRAGRLRWRDLTPRDQPAREVRARCAPYQKEYLRKDGLRVPVLVGSAALDEVSEQWVCFVVDLTEQRRAEGVQRVLAESGAVLATSLEYEETLQRVADLAVPHFGDWCFVDILEGEEGFFRHGVGCADPAHRPLAERFRRSYSLRPELAGGISRALSRAEPQVMPEVEEGFLVSIAPEGELLASLRELGVRSTLTVPLTARGRVLGALTLLSTAASGRRYGEADLAVAEDLARRAATAVDNARLYREARKSRDQLDVILRGVVEGIVAQDVTGRPIFVNDAAARNAGFASPEEMLKAPLEEMGSRYELLDEEGRPVEPGRRPGWAALEGKRLPETVMRLRDRSTGRERWFVANSVPVLDEQRRVRMAISIFHDITALKRAEERITRQSQINELLRRIGESFASELDQQRLVQRITDEATTLTGARFGAFFHLGSGREGGPELDALSGAREEGSAWLACPRAAALLGATFRGGRALRLADVTRDERFAEVPAGEEPSVRSYLAVPVVSRSGEVLGGLFFGHPEEGWFTRIHERMMGGVAAQAAIALDNARLYREAQEAERRAAFLSEASALLATSLDYEITLRQLAWLVVPRLADWCAVEMVGEGGPAQLTLAHVDPARVEAARELQRRYPQDPESPSGLSAVLRTGQPVVYAEITDAMLARNARDAEHLRLLREVGSRSVMIVPIALRGSILGAITFVCSESERRFTPSDLALARSLADRAAVAIDNARHYRAAQEAVRMRDEFMSIASHELRTPLTPLALQLKGLLRALQRLPEPALMERLGSKVEVAVRQTERLAKLVNSLLDVTRITSGRLSLQPEVVDLAALARDVVERFADELESAGCAFTVRADAPVPGRWDRLRVEQVITNLLTNALKYGAGRPIEVEAAVAPDGRALLRVSDQGIGIAPEDQARIFERFERAVSSDAYGGLGLGLYITRRIVEAHGGSIQVQSAPGSGSTFTVLLPPEAAEAIPPPGG